MKPFNSVEAFVKHYEFKNSIPTEVRIAMDGQERRYIRDSKSQYIIEKGRIDRYEFKEYSDFTYPLPQLKVNFLRYFDIKKIVEAYFLLEDIDGQEFLSPIYFDEKFITADDFKQFPNEAIIEQFNFKWVNLNEVPLAFQKERKLAYQEANKALFYEFVAFKQDLRKEMKLKALFTPGKETWEQKWKVDLFTGESPYFTEVVEPNDFW
ncbi:hypothetical protein HV402_18675 [Bacillus sporothermodurans]|nr:hypothetical protein [Heyndrickxia sporothermodurans]MBL5769343.1 hypothetical protein [Heyndrickxia sporothermodurans]MBL5776612.1 hypothetical protein [Heyndrickxia sporothermodurans]MBL5780117.1 hypothetical protein [Heyndrickxia sporothermodurans]MBL5790786.1 hypothetical protein [Heyndrickxia sporothermodurans]MBL5798081.1 hypothetical protein [Heyndrickxia sporothermodurans]